MLDVIGNIVGGLIGNAGKERELKQQREFAKEGVRWRVADARAAGVHPALAMGASIPSYSPVGLGSDLAEGFSSAGQDISRAIGATQTLPERQASEAQTRLSLENMGLQNDLLRAQIMGLTRPRTPPFPMATQHPVPGSESIPLPFGMGEMEVANPGLGQTAEDHFSDIGGFVFGGSNMLDSMVRSIAKSLPMNQKVNPYTKTPIRGSQFYR